MQNSFLESSALNFMQRAHDDAGNGEPYLPWPPEQTRTAGRRWNRKHASKCSWPYNSDRIQRSTGNFGQSGLRKQQFVTLW